MKLTGFWKREKKSEDTPQQAKRNAVRNSPEEPDFSQQKHQKLILRESQLCLTVPQKAVETFKINTKRFIEWQRHKQELHGNLLMSETTHTTRIEHLGHKDQYVAIVPDSSITDYDLKATKDNGPSAICEWNGTTLRIRIPLPQKTKKKNKQSQ